MTDRPDSLERYARAALDRACEAVASAPVHARNHTANTEAFGIGRLLPGSPLAFDEAERTLIAAAVSTGLAERDAAYTVGRALRQGQGQPRDLAHVGASDGILQGRTRGRRRRGAPTPTRTQTPAQRPTRDETTRPRPPRAEVDAVWDAAVSVLEDAEARAWLELRHVNPATVADRDLARVILPGAALPTWARFKGSGWVEVGARLICRAWDATGQPVSLHARSMGRDGPKGIWPSAGPGSAGGLVLADALAVVLLRGEPCDWLERPCVFVAEGVPDWLTYATAWGDAAEDAPAVLGVESGSATPEIAARIPDGAEVVIATDPDEAGERYARAWRDLLIDRCEVKRRVAPKG